MAARTVLEGLESEDLFENEKPVKNEITDTKVKEPRQTETDHQMVNNQRFTCSNSAFLSSVHKTSDRNKRVKEETGDLLRLCHTVPLEVVNLGWLLCVTLSERTS